MTTELGPLLPDHWAQPIADMGNIEIDEQGNIVGVLPDPPGILDRLDLKRETSADMGDSVEFKMSETTQFKILATFLVEARRLALDRGDDEELTALVKQATDALAAETPGANPQ